MISKSANAIRKINKSNKQEGTFSKSIEIDFEKVPICVVFQHKKSTRSAVILTSNNFNRTQL